MPIEVEQKFPLTDRKATVTQLGALGAVSQGMVTQVDTYYAHPSRDFAATDEALRVRRVGEGNCITYKGPKLDAATKTRREIELPLAAGERSAVQWDQLLEALSFRHVAAVAKQREIFQLDYHGQLLEISLDTVAEVGDFIEIEIVVPDETQVDAAQVQLAALANELQLTGSIRTSYLEMLLEKQ